MRNFDERARLARTNDSMKLAPVVLAILAGTAAAAPPIAVLESRVPQELASEGVVLAQRGLTLKLTPVGRELVIALVALESQRIVAMQQIDRLPDDPEAAVAVVTQVAAALAAAATEAPSPAAGTPPVVAVAVAVAGPPPAVAGPPPAVEPPRVVAQPRPLPPPAVSLYASSPRPPSPRWIQLALAAPLAGHDAKGVRLDADLFTLGPLSIGAAGAAYVGDQNGQSTSLYTIGGFFAATGHVDGWGARWRFRITIDGGVGFYRAWRWGPGDNPTLATFDVGAVFGPRIGAWAIAVGPLVMMTGSGAEGFLRADANAIDSLDVAFVLFGGVARAF